MADPLRAALDRHGLGGLFFFHGADAFRREEAVRTVIEAHLDDGVRDFNLDQLRGSDVDVDSLASILATPPMMAEWRVVVIRDADPLAGSPRARKLLVEAAASVPPGLAFVISGDTSSSTAKLWKELKKKTRSVGFPAVSLDDVPGWIVERGREGFDLDIEEAAARALAHAVGADLGVLAQELAKLKEFTDGRRSVTRDDIAAVGTYLPAQDRWEWFDMVAERRFDSAAAALPVLFTQGESGVGLTLALGTLFLRLGVAVERGVRALESTLPPHQRWLARKFARLADRWSVDEVQEAVLGLLRVDRLLKSSPLPEDVVLEEWLLGLQVRSAGSG